MNGAEIALVASVVVSGLWSGLLLTLTTILHPMFVRLDGPDFAVQMRRFLPVARRSPTNYVLVAGLVLGPAVAAVLLADQPAEAPFLLTAGALAATVVGPLLISNRLAEPNYDRMLGWSPDAMPSGWEQVRARYFRINWARAWLTWLAFALLLAATVIELASS